MEVDHAAIGLARLEDGTWSELRRETIDREHYPPRLVAAGAATDAASANVATEAISKKASMPLRSVNEGAYAAEAGVEGTTTGEGANHVAWEAYEASPAVIRSTGGETAPGRALESAATIESAGSATKRGKGARPAVPGMSGVWESGVMEEDVERNGALAGGRRVDYCLQVLIMSEYPGIRVDE